MLKQNICLTLYKLLVIFGFLFSIVIIGLDPVILLQVMQQIPQSSKGMTCTTGDGTDPNSKTAYRPVPLRIPTSGKLYLYSKIALGSVPSEKICKKEEKEFDIHIKLY